MKKLKLEELEIKSLITSMQNQSSEIIKGGWHTSNGPAPNQFASSFAGPAAQY